MNALPDEVAHLGVDDLLIVTSESYINDDGERRVAVYSFSLDAITWLNEDAEAAMRAAGVWVAEHLPPLEEDGDGLPS